MIGPPRATASPSADGNERPLIVWDATHFLPSRLTKVVGLIFPSATSSRNLLEEKGPAWPFDVFTNHCCFIAPPRRVADWPNDPAHLPGPALGAGSGAAPGSASALTPTAARRRPGRAATGRRSRPTRPTRTGRGPGRR